MIRNYTIINQNGDIIKNITCLEDDLNLNCGLDDIAFDGVIKDQWFDFATHTWQAIPPQPNHHWWDTSTHTWQADPDALAEAQATQARQARQQTLNDPVEYNGDWYQADEKSLTAMVTSYNVMLAITGQKIDWKLANNEFREVSVEDLQQLIKLIFERNQRIMKLQ